MIPTPWDEKRLIGAAHTDTMEKMRVYILPNCSLMRYTYHAVLHVLALSRTLSLGAWNWILKLVKIKKQNRSRTLKFLHSLCLANTCKDVVCNKRRLPSHL